MSVAYLQCYTPKSEKYRGKKVLAPSRKGGMSHEGPTPMAKQSLLADRPRACKATKNKAEPVSCTPPPPKRARVESAERQPTPSQHQPAKSTESASSRLCLKCCSCEQILENVKLHRPLSDATDECVMLTSPTLQIEIGSSDLALHSDVPQHKVTCFSVYDENGHLCPFNKGLIEKNRQLYFSGYVKPIVDENPGTEGGVPAHMGPIIEWYTAGFDGGKGILGFSTDLADYILMEPSADYRPYMVAINEQQFFSQLVLSFLCAHPDASYDDLLNEVKATTMPDSDVLADEDRLLFHAPFIVEQVKSFDLAADKDEPLFFPGPCITRLAKVAGCVKENCRAVDERQHRRIPGKRRTIGSLATTTPLVQSVIGSLFRGQIDTKAPGHRRNGTTPCGKCRGCKRVDDCGECDGCKTRKKSSRSSKTETPHCSAKRCSRLEDVHESAEDSEKSSEGEDAEASSAHPTPVARRHRRGRTVQTKWLASGPLVTRGGRAYYSSACIAGEEVCVGDAVVTSGGDLVIVRYMWEATEQQWFHAQHLCKASNTILCEVADPKELFLVDECSTGQLSEISKKIKLVLKKAPPTWNMLGGEEERTHDSGPDEHFYYSKRYTPQHARFEDVLFVDPPADVEYCPGCTSTRELKARDVPVLVGEAVRSGDLLSHSALRFQGHEYSVGGCCYLDPELSFRLGQPPEKKEKNLTRRKLNAEKYPEAYRKGDFIKGSYDDCPEPYRIARIRQIFYRADVKPSAKTIRLKVVPFYRPENTCKRSAIIRDEDLNMVFASAEEHTVDAAALAGVCAVTFLSSPSLDERDQYFRSGHNRFYYTELYDSKTKSFKKVPEDDRHPSGAKEMDELLDSHAFSDIERGNSVATPRLRTLDVFAGCGGLSAGLLESGAVEPQWAIESDPSAAASYVHNHPSCTVFVDDCNLLLRLAMEGKYENAAGQKLPRKGEVDFLCGGPPCQGFSGLNRFNSTLYARFKNSLIASYLSYCDFYRPRFFLLENVRNFVSFDRNVVLKLTLQCLLRMGYQCTFGILQAGCYGVPQTRTRAFIFAAAPGEKLPSFPEPLYVFSRKSVQITTAIDGRRYIPNISRHSSAPFRQMTVRDAISDLPVISSSDSAAENQLYSGAPLTHFQRLVRHNSKTVSGHVCKESPPLMGARIRLIPKEPGADWRDLPNIKVDLNNGQTTELLKYEFYDSTGKKRGVCPCAEGRPCDNELRQDNTIIPWCLPHTAVRHNQWAGLYGRLDWDGFFSTAVTCPEPMGKQGRVLHPNQDRVVSVRELARAQGFSDSFQFKGDLVQQYCQIGNAVPPPLARELGHEIRKCLLWKTSTTNRNVQTADPKQ